MNVFSQVQHRQFKSFQSLCIKSFSSLADQFPRVGIGTGILKKRDWIELTFFTLKNVDCWAYWNWTLINSKKTWLRVIDSEELKYIVVSSYDSCLISIIAHGGSWSKFLKTYIKNSFESKFSICRFVRNGSYAQVLVKIKLRVFNGQQLGVGIVLITPTLEKAWRESKEANKISKNTREMTKGENPYGHQVTIQQFLPSNTVLVKNEDF